MPTFKVGLVGCGWVAPYHLAGLAKLGSRAQIVWVADPLRGRAEALARQVGVQALTDYRHGLGAVDCAFVLVPNHLHHSVSLDCLNAGCHVLIEKPIATTLEQADEMIAASCRNGKVLMVGYPHRYMKSMQFFKQVLERGQYGKPFMLDGLMDEALQGYVSGWIAKKETCGGGVFFSASPHMLDVMLWIGGKVRTICMVGTHGGISMAGEDTAACIIKFENGVIGVTRHTWASPRTRIWYTMDAVCEKAHVTLTMTPLRDLTTEGERCSWSTRIVALGKNEEILLESGDGLDFAPEIAHFFECIETGQKPQTDGQMARDLIALVLGAYGKAQADGGNVD